MRLPKYNRPGAADALHFCRQLLGRPHAHRRGERRAQAQRRLLIAQLELEHHAPVAAVAREQIRERLERLRGRAAATSA